MSSVIHPFTRLVVVINYKSGEWIGSLLQAGSIPVLATKLNIMSRTVKQAYRKSRVFDKTCRNNGACSYCRDNRLHKHNKKLIAYSLNTNKE